MLVVMQQGASEAQIQKIIQRLVEDGFDVHRSTGVIHTVLGGVGGKEDFDTAIVEVMEGLKEVHRIVSPYKAGKPRISSRREPGRPGRQRGRSAAKKIVVMAGPCSVENRDQIETRGGHRRRRWRERHSRGRVQATLFAV